MTWVENKWMGENLPAKQRKIIIISVTQDGNKIEDHTRS